MLGGLNDKLEHAHELGALLKGRAVTTVNLIPYNPTGVGAAYSTSAEETVTEFQMTLRLQYLINTTVRQQMGQDIDGACGQLVINSASVGGATAPVLPSSASSAGGFPAAAEGEPEPEQQVPGCGGSGVGDIEDLAGGGGGASRQTLPTQKQQKQALLRPEASCDAHTSLPTTSNSSGFSALSLDTHCAVSGDVWPLSSIELDAFLDRAETEWGVTRAPAEKALRGAPPASVAYATRSFAADMEAGKVTRNPTGLLIQALRSQVWVNPT